MDIVLIEDNPDDIVLFEEYADLWETKNTRLTVLNSIGQALVHLRNSSASLVVLDLGLPDARGLEGVETIHKANPYLPIVILTGLSNLDMAIRSIQLGAQDYLVKGEFDEKLLEKAVYYSIERKRFENALEESMNNLSEAQHMARLFHWEYNLLTEKLTYSRELLGILHFPENFAPDHSDLERLIHPEDLALVRQRSSEALKGLTPVEYIHRIYTCTKVLRHFQVRVKAVKNSQGQIVAMKGISQDVTEKIESERKNIKARERFRVLVESMSEGLILVGRGNRIKYANPTFCRIAGCTDEDIVGRKASALLAPYGRKLFSLNRILKDHRTSGKCESEILLDDGQKKKRFRCNMIPVDSGNEHPEQYFGIFSDVTEEKAESDRILTAIIETQEQERRRFSQDLHDGLGQILTALRINFDVVRKKIYRSKEGDEVMMKIESLINSAIQDTRNISRNLMPQTLQQFGVCDAIRELCSGVITAGLKVRCTFPREKREYSPEIETAVFRVVQEMLNNTLKHSGADRIIIGLRDRVGYLEVKYRDNGTGFVQQPGRHSGHGLRNISSRVNLLNGHIKIASGNGKGFQAHIKIPLSGNMLVTGMTQGQGSV